MQCSLKCFLYTSTENHLKVLDNHRSGDIILLSSVTQVNPVSKGGDHVESEGVEKAQRYLEIIYGLHFYQL